MSIENKLTHRDEKAVEKIQQRPAVAPPVDIYESQEALLVVADLPGVTHDTLSIHLEKGELTFEGRRGDAAETREAGVELPDFRRSFMVPQGIDAEKITADLQAGVLKVRLPKSAALKPRQIPITPG